MRNAIMAVLVGLVVLLIAAGCTTTIEVAPAPTSSGPSTFEEIWVDDWAEDGSSRDEGRCIWRAMIELQGSEAALLGHIMDGDTDVVALEMLLEPSVYRCLE